MYKFVLGNPDTDYSLERIEGIYIFSNLKYYDTSGAVSKSHLYYRIMSRELGITIYIWINSDEGKEFEEWLSSHNNLITIDDAYVKLLEIILPLISNEDFQNIMENLFKLIYTTGYEMAQSTIRKAIGIKN